MATTKAAVIDAVLSAASSNSVLLNRISTTSDGPPLLRGHEVYLSRLEESLAEQDALLASAKTTVDALAKSHAKLRDSTFRRLYHRATRMRDAFERRAAAEEQKYVAALGDRSRAEERLRQIREELDEALRAKGGLEMTAKEHERAHAAIDELYERLFAGPTPGFGQEDEKEGAFYAARERNDATKTKIQGARRALRWLEYTVKYLDKAEGLVGDAGREAEEALFFLDDAHRLLQYAVRHTKNAILSVERAGQALEDLTPEMQTAMALVLQKLQDVERQAHGALPDNLIISVIATAKSRLKEARADVAQLRELVKQREQTGLEEIKMTARAREDWRQALYQIRMRIFEEVAGFGEAAPAYTECCDRASGYCAVPDEPFNHGMDMPELGEDPPPPAAACESTPQQAPPAYASGPPPQPLITTRLELPPPRPQRVSHPLTEKPPVPNGPDSLEA